MSNPDKLTPREEAFVREYLIDLSATNAAKRAGYSAKTAKEQGYQLLQRPRIAAAIQAAMQARNERLDASADDVLREITRLAMFDPAAFVNVKKPADVAKLPENVRRAIVGWSWDRLGHFTLKLAKEGALEMLARHHALYKVHVEHSGPNGGPIPVAAVTMSDQELMDIAAGKRSRAANA